MLTLSLEVPLPFIVTSAVEFTAVAHVAEIAGYLITNTAAASLAIDC